MLGLIVGLSVASTALSLTAAWMARHRRMTIQRIIRLLDDQEQ